MPFSAPTRSTAWLALRFVLAVLLSGCLLALALPPANISELGWVCWVPVFFAVTGRGIAFGFAGGIFSCLVAAAICDKGWFYAEKLYGASNGWTYAGCAIFGLAAAVAGMAVGAQAKLSWKRALLVAAIAVLGEACLLVYLPAHLALTQHQNVLTLGVAQIGGIWTASLLVWFVNAYLASALSQSKWVPFAVVAGLAGLSSFGSRFVQSETGNVPIAVIQTLAGDPETMMSLNAEAAGKGAALAVWPELSGQGIAASGDPARLSEIAREPGQIPFITSFADGSTPKPFNTAILFSRDGDSAPYRKRKPFAAERQMHQAGSDPVVVSYAGVRYGLGICFDSCYPNVMNDLVTGQSSAQIILLPTLDPETPHGFAAAVHAAYSSFRAAETGVPIVRADIVGWSHAVDRNGRLIGQMGLEPDAVAVYRVNPGSGPRLATRLGNALLLIPVAIVGLAVSHRLRKRRSAVDLAENDVDRADDGDDVRNQTPDGEHL